MFVWQPAICWRIFSGLPPPYFHGLWESRISQRFASLYRWTRTKACFGRDKPVSPRGYHCKTWLAATVVGPSYQIRMLQAVNGKPRRSKVFELEAPGGHTGCHDWWGTEQPRGTLRSSGGPSHVARWRDFFAILSRDQADFHQEAQTEHGQAAPIEKDDTSVECSLGILAKPRESPKFCQPNKRIALGSLARQGLTCSNYVFIYLSSLYIKYISYIYSSIYLCIQ